LYSGLISAPKNPRPFSDATKPVVPAPQNGSKTTSLRLLPARMHGFISFLGNVAK